MNSLETQGLTVRESQEVIVRGFLKVGGGGWAFLREGLLTGIVLLIYIDA